MVKLKFSRENTEVKVPSKRLEDAGYDVYANPVWFREQFPMGFKVLKKGKTMIIPTGLRCAINEGWYIQMAERGSTGVKAMKYGAGIVDSKLILN